MILKSSANLLNIRINFKIKMFISTKAGVEYFTKCIHAYFHINMQTVQCDSNIAKMMKSRNYSLRSKYNGINTYPKSTIKNVNLLK